MYTQEHQCGYVFEGNEAPDKCPQCMSPIPITVGIGLLFVQLNCFLRPLTCEGPKKTKFYDRYTSNKVQDLKCIKLLNREVFHPLVQQEYLIIQVDFAVLKRTNFLPDLQNLRPRQYL